MVKQYRCWDDYHLMIWTLTVTLTWKNAIQLYACHSNLWWCIMTQGFHCSQDKEWTGVNSHFLRSWTFTVTPTFSNDIPAHDHAPQYYVWLQMAKQFRKYPNKKKKKEWERDTNTERETHKHTEAETKRQKSWFQYTPLTLSQLGSGEFQDISSVWIRGDIAVEVFSGPDRQCK